MFLHVKFCLFHFQTVTCDLIVLEKNSMCVMQKKFSVMFCVQVVPHVGGTQPWPPFSYLYSVVVEVIVLWFEML